MPRDYSRSWKHHLELGHLEKKSHFSDDEQVTKAMAYLEEAASSNCPSFYNNNKEVRCHCHASLCTNEDYRNAVAIHVLWWARLDKETQQVLLMEKIKVGKLLNRVVRDSKVYSLPFMTEIFELAESLAGIKICKNALMAIFRIGRGFWKICERDAATTGTAPKHALKGKENVRSKIFKQECKPQLAEFFKHTVSVGNLTNGYMMSAPLPRIPHTRPNRVPNGQSTRAVRPSVRTYKPAAVWPMNNRTAMLANSILGHRSNKLIID